MLFFLHALHNWACNFSADKHENANNIVGIFIFMSSEIFMLSYV